MDVCGLVFVCVLVTGLCQRLLITEGVTCAHTYSCMYTPIPLGIK